MYNNPFSRTNPGLIVVIIDQSASMNAMNEKGETLAEVAARSVNNLITDYVLFLTTTNSNEEEIVKRSFKLVLIGHGGSNDNAYVILDKWIDEVSESYPIVKQTINTREGDYEKECLDVLLPIASGKQDLFGAFSMAKEFVIDWISNHNKAEDPLPYIINVSNDCITDNEDTIRIVNEIKEIKHPDGSPLIINGSLSVNNNHAPLNSYNSSECEKSQFLFKLSSPIPSDLYERINGYGIRKERLYFVYFDLANECQNLRNLFFALFHHHQYKHKLR